MIWRYKRPTITDGQRGVFVVIRCHSLSDHGPSHPYYGETERVGFSPPGQALFAPRAKLGEVFGESHEV